MQHYYPIKSITHYSGSLYRINEHLISVTNLYSIDDAYDAYVILKDLYCSFSISSSKLYVDHRYRRAVVSRLDAKKGIINNQTSFRITLIENRVDGIGRPFQVFSEYTSSRFNLKMTIQSMLDV